MPMHEKKGSQKGCLVSTLVLTQGSKPKSYPRIKDALPRQFGVKVQGLQMVILASDVEDSKRDLTPLARQTVTGKKVELRQFVARQIFIVKSAATETSLAIVLEVPIKLRAGEKSGWMIE